MNISGNVTDVVMPQRQQMMRPGNHTLQQSNVPQNAVRKNLAYSGCFAIFQTLALILLLSTVAEVFRTFSRHCRSFDTAMNTQSSAGRPPNAPAAGAFGARKGVPAEVFNGRHLPQKVNTRDTRNRINLQWIPGIPQKSWQCPDGPVPPDGVLFRRGGTATGDGTGREIRGD